LIQVLDRIPKSAHPDLLVGFETADDAGVFRIDDQRALVQTVDFFTPVVDDPYLYGAIAAANALSDVYAMGGSPLTALAITCFPDRPAMLEILAQIMLGGADKLREAGVALVGGHTVCDAEIKFGYAVTGLVNPKQILTNAGARPGDALILTKPLGIGIITTAIKRGRATPETIAKAAGVMTALNRDAAEILARYRCSAATDITGNGLLGHAFEMGTASRVTLRLQARSVPFLPEAYPLAEAGVFPGLIAKTWKLIEARTVLDAALPEPLRIMLVDPQTSGGLLAALHPDDLEAMLGDLRERNVQAAVIGRVESAGDAVIVVEDSGSAA